ncbi:hypothetical protein DJFAAGMI_01185 [Comamonas sp. PE63]|uniref:DNA topoisomerase n=1 Tax=Comamonas brasiliensis TaxID=1812482 RepID=A0ABS5LPM5_9BURK|nr:DNA topoisomerase IB [Comamonas sp. PE63]MBS3018453.1 hypothetical protein [Comamonas sp. PE63]
MQNMPAQLVHVDDTTPGWSRVRRGKSFSYADEQGKTIRDSAQLDRIRKLAIPPAYTEVWICPSPEGHIQATARDDKGRKQYRYHPLWQEHQEHRKFRRMLDFGKRLPILRQKVERDLSRRQCSLVTVTAAVVRLLDRTALRIGNEEYVSRNGSYGLSTLKGRHVRFHGDRLTFQFRGKSGVMQKVTLVDRKVSRVVRQCQSLPGKRLFQFMDECGQVQSLRSVQVNAYIRSACGASFTAKDFRTWQANVWALDLIRSQILQAPADRVQIVREVAGRLGNTYSVCRKFYIYPAVLDALPTAIATPTSSSAPLKGLQRVENDLINFLKSHATKK